MSEQDRGDQTNNEKLATEQLGQIARMIQDVNISSDAIDALGAAAHGTLQGSQTDDENGQSEDDKDN